ncbi:alpha-L-rhamnosidase N-terminal domain-containing protein, partial [bacterium]|nr:alpha-L-rhamnosidase N-terminal domain-containing protein [bacterium]
MMKKVIINADDLGISKGTNQAIMKDFREGILTSASLMANMPGYEDAVGKVIPNNPGLGIGIHLSLTIGKSVLDKSKIPLLVDESGYFKNSFFKLYKLVQNVYPHCSTVPATFAEYMKYLHDQGCMVIAMRDLAKYVNPNKRPKEPYDAIKRRLGVTPVQLKCEYAVNPLGIDVAQPRFSWVLESSRRGQMQSAYQILVASSEENLRQNIADLWDSGKVVSGQSVNVAYKGSALKSGQKCWWKVRCWNKPGEDGMYVTPTYHDVKTLEAMRKERPSAYSAPATFEMGLLKQSDWQGNWIGADKTISSPLLRKEFTLEKEVKRARVYISGLGYYELYLNGEKVGNHVLDPGTTYYNNDQSIDFGSRVLYVTYDVTDRLRTGGNAIGVMLGHGWYSAEDDIPPSPSHREPYGDRPRLILQMNIEFADGDSVSIATRSLATSATDTWKTSAGPITYNDYC